MLLQHAPVSRTQRTPTSGAVGPVGRLLLPVFGIMLLATATAGAAWLLLFAIDFGCRLLGA